MEWFQVKNSEDLISPSLLVYPDRIRKNIELMIAIAGGTDNLRPHIKTHKIGELVALQQSYGIQKFKCATIAEAELLGQNNAEDVLLAMQPVGSQINRFFQLVKKYPKTNYSTLVDNEMSLTEFVNYSKKEDSSISLWLDINNGMNRTGIIPNLIAKVLYEKMYSSEYVNTKGFHVYDGHNHVQNMDERKKVCDKDFLAVIDLKKSLEKDKISIDSIVAGGSITFPIHSKREGVEVSPGTPVFWDAGYKEKYKDLDFLPAAVLFMRVVSNPTENRTCLDLGHKSVASEMSFPRVKFLGKSDIEQIEQHEEHLVIKNSESFEIGDNLYALPIHICPTVSKYKKVHIIKNNEVVSSWNIAARDHQLKI